MYIVYMDDSSTYQCVHESQFDKENFVAIKRGSREFCMAYINSMYTDSKGDFETRNHRDIVDDNNNKYGADLSPWKPEDF